MWPELKFAKSHSIFAEVSAEVKSCYRMFFLVKVRGKISLQIHSIISVPFIKMLQLEDERVL